MNHPRLVSFATVLALSCVGAVAELGPIRINAATTIVIDAREPGPLQKAASDVASDFEKVFGRRPGIVRSSAEAGPVNIWIGANYRPLRNTSRPAGWETLSIHVVHGPRASGIELTGSDVRGAIYAIYQFTQQFFGVDPLYWWTDHKPRRVFARGETSPTRWE